MTGRGVLAWADGVGTVPGDEGAVEALLRGSAEAGGARVVGGMTRILPCPLSREGSPPGGAAFVLLDESHVSLHWYDLGDGKSRYAFDAFSCGGADSEKILDEILRVLGGCERRGVADRFSRDSGRCSTWHVMTESSRRGLRQVP